MIFRPAQLGMAKLDRLELEADKKACRKIGPCGVGKKALYLNSFYIDRRYYLPYGSISRVFKRVAMSSGGFTGQQRPVLLTVVQNYQIRLLEELIFRHDKQAFVIIENTLNVLGKGFSCVKEYK